jgi:hypothetical protein
MSGVGRVAGLGAAGELRGLGRRRGKDDGEEVGELAKP